MYDAAETIEIESATSPQHVQRVNRVKSTAMRNASLPLLAAEAPGMYVADADAEAALLPNLS